jgi:hypothetical protein
VVKTIVPAIVGAFDVAKAGVKTGKLAIGWMKLQQNALALEGIETLEAPGGGRLDCIFESGWHASCWPANSMLVR